MFFHDFASWSAASLERLAGMAQADEWDIVNDRVERFPVSLQGDEARRTEVVRQAVQHAKFRIEDNYKTAIPQYYCSSRADSDPGRLQLLLPLCLEDLSRADLALSVDKVGQVYRAATVLTLDMAYNNARLIARPDNEWLQPLGLSRITTDDIDQPREADEV